MANENGKDVADSLSSYSNALNKGTNAVLDSANQINKWYAEQVNKIADEERFFKETEDVFKHIDRLGGVYECVQKEYSKATAIAYIKKELALQDDEIYAFGDSSNDFDMIKAAGHGVIMGHHDPVLEPYAEYITDTVENDGLYKAMEHYGLI